MMRFGWGDDQAGGVRRGGALAVIVAGVLLSAQACGSSGPSADSTCTQYNGLSASDRDAAAKNVLDANSLDTRQYKAAEVDLGFFCSSSRNADAAIRNVFTETGKQGYMSQ